jgi:hypothetical protein
MGGGAAKEARGGSGGARTGAVARFHGKREVGKRE